jgi:catechol 2,3-dioxygenase-like lactoylglutathione lyase family enzyme
MTYPNTLIFVDFASPDPEAQAAFYGEVFGWKVEGRPAGVFHRAVPGEQFLLDDGTTSGVGNLHLGFFNVTNARPHPDPAGVEPRQVAKDGRATRTWILVSPDDTQDRILDTADKLGAKILWRDHYWAEFNGFNGAFEDPWGTTVVLWTKGGPEPQIPDGFTRE